MSPTQRDVGLPNIPLVHCSCTRLAPPLTCLDLRPTPFDASCFFQLHTSHCHFRSVVCQLYYFKQINFCAKSTTTVPLELALMRARAVLRKSEREQNCSSGVRK
ncbi:hypothetical protein ACSBR2_032447 [Camellia fascicularis]